MTRAFCRINGGAQLWTGHPRLFGHWTSRGNRRQHGLWHSKGWHAGNDPLPGYRGRLKQHHRKLRGTGLDKTGSSGEGEITAGRFTQSDDPVRLKRSAMFVCSLASKEASYVTGQIIVVDGGNTIQEYKVDLNGS